VSFVPLWFHFHCARIRNPCLKIRNPARCESASFRVKSLQRYNLTHLTLHGPAVAIVVAMTHAAKHHDTSRMLLVEDERVVLTALKKFFTREGFHVDCARELEEAEALIATSHYAIVIADLRLSWSYAVEGLEILRFVRHHSRGTRVIILTAHTAPEIQRSARALGAEAFLAKPTPLPEIAATVHRLMGAAS
jgi:CheY-like chemotaxis protein